MFAYIILCTLLAFSNLHGIQATLKIKFIEDLCFMTEKTTLELNYEVSGILMSAPRYGTDGFRCELTLVPQRGSSVVLSIYRYDIPDTDQLIIQDSDRHTISIIGMGVFKDEKKAIISDGKLIIKYTKNNTASYYSPRSGFQFTYTQVNDYYNGKCHSNEYKCRNGKCIYDYLVCDGHNHCGDNSDQIKCTPGTPATPYVPPKKSNVSIIWISSITIAASVLSILIVITIIVIIRGRIKKRETPGQEEGTQSGGNIPLESISTSTTPNVYSEAPQPKDERETFYNRLRRSFRGGQRKNVEEVETQRQETFQVPSMYPNLDQIPSAPELSGAENPTFKSEE